ncbi:bifunctional diguanylate cyclase/phosphodiesterase [Dyella caseinilytica]|uniref:EAL domain-containing protein n=1 Tax=Dyella caseinilytica TaxID=1849581 RepID=A0ABX7GY05_9GAMM|nr:EAL domain-containing protein [Dyella caseinilytica]QRN55372.1 EAL domain-containing protein [Dyella caseinilytica]GGA01243.1 bifunctional diguanylate cyclase/phosphodiesterase [Dyella caseinilytica]
MSRTLPIQARPVEEPDHAAWLSRLIEATTPEEVGALIEALAMKQPGCARAQVLWLNPYGHHHATDTPLPDGGVVELARNTLKAGEGLLSPDGKHYALTLLSQEQVVVLLGLTGDVAAKTLLGGMSPYLQLGVRQLYHAMKLADLYDSHAQLEHSENLQRALFAISDLSGSNLDMPDMLHEIHRIVSGLMYAENFFIVRYHPERDTMRFLYYADIQDQDQPDTTREIQLEDRRHTLTWYLLTQGKPLMGSDEQLIAQVNGPLILSGPDSDDWLGVPMLHNGSVHGALVVQNYSTGLVYSRDDLTLLEFVGSHILTALERKESKNELERRVRQRTEELAEVNRGLRQEVRERQRAEHLQEALFQLAQLATADIDESAFYERVHTVVGGLLDARNFFIALLSDDRSKLDFPYYIDTGVHHTISRPVGRGLSEYVIRLGEPWSGKQADIIALMRDGEVVRHGIGEPCACWLGVPLKVDESTIGVVVVQSYDQNASYGPAEKELLSFVALQIANSIYRRRSAAALHMANLRLEHRVEERTRELRAEIARREQMQQQLHHQVMHDPLTGLPNRGYLRERLDTILTAIQHEPHRRCALLYLDVDRFKVINDSLGHLAGDEFLKAIAMRLLTHVREPDMVARLSGDEFAILLEDIEVTANATAIADRVLQAVATPLRISGKELEPSVSVGIACGDSSYLDADELIRDADMALYQAKQLGRKRFAIFDEALAKDMVDVLTMESELRKALRQNEFEPFFQPIFRLDDGKIMGYEALIRWNHPQRGLLRPMDFVRIAEDSGLIEAIDWRLFEISCRMLAQRGSSETFVTFNVSALHLRHSDFDTRILKMLERTGLSPSRLVTEVTEGALLDNPESVRVMLDRLRSVGVGAALDDFGTGYSSLSYLHSLPMRMLKIDRAFVHELDKVGSKNSTTVVAAILALAHALNIQVIAEGIETQAQFDTLLSMGCEMGQGYLLGHPGPIDHWL